MKKLLRTLLLISMPAILLTGCRDLNEPENLSLITVMGVNLAPDNRYEVIVQDQTLTQGGQQMQTSNWTFDIHKATGRTIGDAIQNDAKINPQRIYLSHTKVIILSEELVRRQGIRPVVDFLGRNPQIRQNTLFLIAKKGDFQKVFLPNAKLNADTGTIIEKIIKNKNINSFITESRVREFLELYWGTCTTPYALGVGTNQSFMEGKSIDQSYENLKEKNTYDLDVGDIAVFKDGKMAGWLTGETSRGFLLVKGQVNGGNITIHYKGKPVDIRISQTKSGIEPDVEEQRVKMKINVYLSAKIGESYADINFDDKSVLDRIRKVLNTHVRKEIKSAVDASKSYGADIFGFRNLVFENYPNYWKAHKSEWAEGFPPVDVSIRVTSNIQHIGLEKKPAKTVK